MMAGWVYARAAVEAELHVQVTIEAVALPHKTPGAAKVRGTVARVFRGMVPIGTSLVVDVDVLGPDDSPARGGTLWMRVADLQSAAVLEAFLNRQGEGFAIALWQSTILPALTEVPAMVVDPASAIEPPMLRMPGRTMGLLAVGACLAFVVACYAYAIAALLD